MLRFLQALAAAALLLAAVPAMGQPTALDRYVAARDPAYG